MPYLVLAIKLHMYCLTKNKVCLWLQTHLAQGSLGSVYDRQVNQLVWLILLFLYVTVKSNS